MEKIIKIFSVVLFVIVLLTACGIKNPDEIEVDLDINFSDKSETVNASKKHLLDRLHSWESEHPEIKVNERERIRNSDFLNLAVLGPEHLPDLFITDCKTGYILAREGLLMRINTDSGIDAYKTLTYEGSTYAFPLFNNSASVVIYNPDNWKSGGEIGYYSDSTSIAAVFMSGIMSDETGQEWLQNMIDGNQQSAFTDSFFIERLDKIKKNLNESVEFDSLKTLISQFANESIPAVALSGDDVYRLLQEIKIRNSELYDKLEFTSLNEGIIPVGYDYGLFLNRNLIRFSGSSADYLSILDTLTIPQEDSDPTIERLNLLVDSSEHALLVTQYFSNMFWYYAGQECFKQLVYGDNTLKEYAAALQNYYETYYLNLENYSELLSSELNKMNDSQ